MIAASKRQIFFTRVIRSDGETEGARDHHCAMSFRPGSEAMLRPKIGLTREDQTTFDRWIGLMLAFYCAAGLTLAALAFAGSSDADRRAAIERDGGAVFVGAADQAPTAAW